LQLSETLEAYLDIETTGLSSTYDEITVIGIYIIGGIQSRFVQLVGEDITSDKILEAFQGITALYTYNGSRFDIPFIQRRYGVNLNSICRHRDLMYHCWQKKLYGGLKAVERCVGIERRLKDVNGYEAVRLWWQYRNNYDQEALNTLLEYNKEDVINLHTLRGKLHES
jgi:uncharacterized protein